MLRILIYETDPDYQKDNCEAHMGEVDCFLVPVTFEAYEFLYMKTFACDHCKRSFPLWDYCNQKTKDVQNLSSIQSYDIPCRHTRNKNPRIDLDLSAILDHMLLLLVSCD